MYAICIINTSGNYGGAEKRFVSLFEHVNSERNDFLLIINKALYDQMTEKGILTSHERVRVIDIPFDHKSYPGSKHSDDLNVSVKKTNPLRTFLGRRKYFLKTVFQWLIFSGQLNRILKKHDVRTVYAVWQGGIWGRVRFKKLNIRIIYGANSNLVWHLGKDLLNRFDSQYRILRDANHVDFLSTGLVEELKGLMPPEDFPESYSVSPCSFIDYQKFYPAQPKENSVVFMGRLVALKNPMLFLEAVKIFNTRYNGSADIGFYVLGTGPEETNMRVFAGNNELTNVSFEGKVTDPQKYLKRSKVFISIQQTENYPGQALMEAMACENAVIVSDVGETRKLVADEEGILVPLDAETIASALAELLSDEEGLRLKGKNAREKVMKEHTVEHFKEYFYKLTCHN